MSSNDFIIPDVSVVEDAKQSIELTISILESQLQTARKDYDKLLEMKNEALIDPVSYVESLCNYVRSL